eukprot:5662009-Alexandrium_andersonii.AAC.1
MFIFPHLSRNRGFVIDRHRTNWRHHAPNEPTPSANMRQHFTIPAAPRSSSAEIRVEGIQCCRASPNGAGRC